MSSRIANLGGYNCNFVEQLPDDLICLICTFVAKDPQQVTCCGKIYCQVCLLEHQKRSDDCPQCRKRSDSFEDKRSNRGIQRLMVKCDNIDNGCQWTGELQKLEHHLGECLYQLVPCPNECEQEKKKVELLLKDMEDHLQSECPNRIIKCTHCQVEGKYIDITTNHIEACKRSDIPCTNEGCSDMIPREELFNHRVTCSYERFSCKYSHIGCSAVLLRKDRESHESNDQLHLHLALETITKMKSGVTNSSSYGQNGLTFRMKDFNTYKTKDMVYFSPPFYSKPGGYKLCLRVYASGWMEGYLNSLSVFVFFMRGENDDNLQWPFTGIVTIELLNQLQDDQHYKHEVKYIGEDDETNNRVTKGEMSSSGYGTTTYISHSDLGYHSELHCQYLKDDCLFFRVTVDAPPPIKPWLMYMYN